MPIYSIGLTNVVVRESPAQMESDITIKGQALTEQVNGQNIQRENLAVRTIAYKMIDFKRMSHPIFIGSNTLKDPHKFVDELHNIFVAMGATNIENVKLASYQLKEVAQSWCKMWQDSRTLGGVPITWELFINLKQGTMTVRKYSLKFVKLPRYITSLVSNNRDETSSSSQESQEI